jgi:UDP-N-acetylglucosamine--N-acetylmuramyl-(pentapeptide) pyrophosphoryl-undecaprenol N-acetylglucosamine transferase
MGKISPRSAEKTVADIATDKTHKSSPRPLKIVMAGGGTGGHLFPGIAIAREFKRRDPASEITFVSTGNPLERSVVAKAGFAMATIAVEGLKGRGLWRQGRAFIKLPRSMFQAMRILALARPHLVIGLGSYSAGPTVLSAWLRRTGIVLHEQNLLPGITNRFLARFADRICVSFDQTAARFAADKVQWTGNPVRADILESRRRESDTGGVLKSDAKFTVLIIGGSQGAHSVNLAVIDALEHLTDRGRLNFIHQTGAADKAMVSAAYARHDVAAVVETFIEDMAACYQAADLIVCRAGATTIAEITALGKAAIFVPFPHAADNHQVLNANTLVENEAAEMILEEDLCGSLLAQRMAHLAAHPELLQKIRERVSSLGKPDAVGAIVDVCYRVLASRGIRP